MVNRLFLDLFLPCFITNPNILVAEMNLKIMFKELEEFLEPSVLENLDKTDIVYYVRSWFALTKELIVPSKVSEEEE